MITHTSRGPKPPSVSMDKDIDRVMAEWAQTLQRAINDPWPEKTGRSRWTIIKVGDDYSVGSPARYAPFVHLRGESAPFVQIHAPAIVARVGAKTSTQLAAAVSPHISIRGVDNG